jgi:hypothetical protein
MTIRRSIAATAATVLVASTLTFGVAGSAAAEPPIFIPDCAHMLIDPPTYFDDFAAINGQPAVAFTPARPLYGSDRPILKAFLNAWGATNCSWKLGKDATRNFTVSEVHMSWISDRLFRRWMANHGIVGVDQEGTLGGILYQVNDHEWSLLIHGRVWISIVERGTSVFGYTMQAASYEIANLNPWIYTGSE